MEQQPESMGERTIHFCMWTVLPEYLNYAQFLTWDSDFQAHSGGLISFLMLHFEWSNELFSLMCRPVPEFTPSMKKMHRPENEVLKSKNSHKLQWNIFLLVFTDELMLSYLGPEKTIPHQIQTSV